MEIDVLKKVPVSEQDPRIRAGSGKGAGQIISLINGDPDPFMTERSHFERFCKRPFGKPSKSARSGAKRKERSFVKRTLFL